MPELILLGISIVAITLLWRLGARKTYLDAARDGLFDLRDDYLKSYFLSTEAGLEDPLYAKLRILINNHLRYTEKFSFVSYIAVLVVLRARKDEFAEEQREHEAQFMSQDAKRQEVSNYVRQRATEIMLVYMVKSSIFARLLIFAAILTMVIAQINKYVHALLRPRTYRNYMQVAVLVAMTVIPMRLIPGLPANATQNAIESIAAEA